MVNGPATIDAYKRIMAYFEPRIYIEPLTPVP